MAETNDLAVCPVCNEKYLTRTQTVFDNSNFVYCECQRCGKFTINRMLSGGFIPPRFAEVRHLVSAWIRRENKHPGIPQFPQGPVEMNNDEWLLRFKRMGFPQTITEKLDALLLLYANHVGTNYDLKFSATSPDFIAEVAAKDQFELRGLAELLMQIGYISSYTGLHEVTITASGWLHIDQLQRTVVASDSAFIAMWFDKLTENYRTAVVSAVEFCGYKPVVVDQVEFTGFIMDQVISLIRQSRFVIADFTCRPEMAGDRGQPVCGVRGGVYWESGLAYGAGKPVIHTCEDNPEAKARLHFDIGQYNTLFWTNDDLTTNLRDLSAIKGKPTFAERVAARILDIVGKGSYDLKQTTK